MRRYSVLESMKGECSRHGRGNARSFFFSFLFSLRRVFFSFSLKKLISASHFIIIYYFARYSCIAFIMLLKPRSPRSFPNKDNKCFLGFFLNNSNKKLLTPQAVDIHIWNLSHYYFTMFHICRTIRRHFSLRQVKLCIGKQKYKQKFTTQGSTERTTKRVNSRSLT